jgi:hypothetical protein
MSDWESKFEAAIDQQIREARERGSFDDLPGAGKPLKSDSEHYTENWWLADLAARENVGVHALPLPLALRREAQDLRAGLIPTNSEAAAREAVEDYNARADHARRRPHSGPSVVIPLVDVEEALQVWRERREAGR